MKKETLHFAEWISKNKYYQKEDNTWHRPFSLIEKWENADNPDFHLVANTTEDLYNIWKAEIYIDPKDETMEHFVERTIEECNFDTPSIPESERDINATLKEQGELLDTLLNSKSNLAAFDFVFRNTKKNDK